EVEDVRVGRGGVGEARPIRSLEIFRHPGAEISSEQSGNRTVAIDEHQRAAAQREEAADRAGQTDEVPDLAAVDELGAARHAFDQPAPEYEWKIARAGEAPQADAAEARMLAQQLLFERIRIRRCACACRDSDADPRSRYFQG